MKHWKQEDANRLKLRDLEDKVDRYKLNVVFIGNNFYIGRIMGNCSKYQFLTYGSGPYELIMSRT